MRRRTQVILFAISLAGCATPTFKAAEFPGLLGLTLICADKSSVDRTCRPAEGPAISDRGTVIPETVVVGRGREERVVGVYIPACWKPALRELWMPAGPFCDLLAHEFCHMDGLTPDRECEERYP